MPGEPAPTGANLAAEPGVTSVWRRGPLMMTALVAALGGAAIYGFGLPALWRMSWPYGLLFTALGLTQLGSAVAVLARYDVGYVVTNARADTPAWAELVQVLADRGIPHGEAVEGQRIATGDGVVLTLLNAVPSNVPDEAFHDDQSLVVYVAYGAASFLLPSDITEQAEARLAATIPPATVLLAGRNGAADATSAAWLAAVQPSAVAISVKPDARAVLPDPVLLARVQADGVAIWRTDERGAVEWVTDAQGLWVTSER